MSVIAKYLDPKNDLVFRRLFGAEKHKSIPIAFLNAALELSGDKTIKDLEFLTTRQSPEVEARKESIVDVLVEDQRGVKYIVEMQVAKVAGFEKRAQYYAAKTYCAHFGVGGKYHDLKKVVFLAITNYVVFPEKQDRYKSDHIVLDKESHEHDLKNFSFTFVELPKFTKKLSELKTIEDRWYYFLKHGAESNDVDVLVANHPEIKEAYDVLDRFRWSESDLQWYEKLIMDEADTHGALEAAKEDGIAEGLAKGKAEGLAKGKAEGVVEGKIQVAKKLLSMGLSSKEVSAATGLGISDIEKQ